MARSLPRRRRAPSPDGANRHVRAIPANPRVRLGSTTAATVVSSTGTRIVFTAPDDVVAGSYDISVFDATGTQQDVLTAGLTYVDGSGDGSGASGSGTPSTGAGGSSTGGSGPGGSTSPSGGSGSGGSGSSTGPGAGSGSGAAGSGAAGSGAAGSGSGGTGPGSTATVTKTGAHGERLVRSTRFAALSAIWSLDCSASCSGVTI